MSLYEGLEDDKDKKESKPDLSGWGSMHKMLAIQKQLQAKNKASQLQPKVDLIVKLGGSAITDKAIFETAKMHEMKLAAQLIKTCLEKKLKCIVVHGAGSFGHHQAKEYGVNKGWIHGDLERTSKVKTGFAKTRLSVLKLNHIVTEMFDGCGISAIGVPACGVWHDELEDFEASTFVSHVVDCLDKDFVPVCHGDAIFDAKQGCRILSGDVIIKTLCSELEVDRVVFLSDVDGILTKPPTETGAHVIQDIFVNQDKSIDVSVSTNSTVQDVTGGIKLKLDSACHIVCNSVGRTTVFVCGVKSTAAQNICLFEDPKGENATKIVYKEASS